MSIGELSPGGGQARMTRAQVKAYIAKMKAAQEEAKRKLTEAQKNGEGREEREELARIEEELNNL